MTTRPPIIPTIIDKIFAEFLLTIEKNCNTVEKNYELNINIKKTLDNFLFNC